MFSWRRRIPPSSKAAFLAAIACAGVAFWLVAAQLREARTAKNEHTVAVVEATRDLAAGTTIELDDVAVHQIADALVPAGALTSTDDAVGSLTITPFLEGEVLASTRLASAAGPASLSIPSGFVGLTLTPDAAPEGLGGGDHVDVLATYATARPYTTAVAEDVPVLNVTAAGSSFGDGAGPAVTLLLDPVVARDVVRADVTATVSLVVRGFTPVP